MSEPGEFGLVSTTLGGLPVVNHFLNRLGLPGYSLADHRCESHATSPCSRPPPGCVTNDRFGHRKWCPWRDGLVEQGRLLGVGLLMGVAVSHLRRCHRRVVARARRRPRISRTMR